jgi:hypothetical protein
MPLYRALLLSLLFPALCLAQEAAWTLPEGLDPATPITSENAAGLKEILPSLEFLGYAFEEKSKNLLNPEGVPATWGELQKLYEPFNILTSDFGSLLRVQVLSAGYRINEETGEVLSPHTKKPILIFEAQILKRHSEISLKHSSLERLTAFLATQDDNKPLSPEALQHARMLIAGNEKDIPKSLLDAMQGAETLKTAALRESAAAAYADSTRLFDGQLPLTQKLRQALPIIGGWNEPAEGPSYFDSGEEKLGRELGKDAQDILRKNPVGRELLKKLRGPLGKKEFPRFIIMNSASGDGKTYEHAAATYNGYNDTVQLELNALRERLLEISPDDRKDEARRASKNSFKLTKFLNENPALRKKISEAIIGDTVHELTHALQRRRDGKSIENFRDNTPSAILVEDEHEANLFAIRFFHAELMRDAEGAAKRHDAGIYQSALADFDAFRDGITRRYFQIMPHAAATLPDLKKIQQTRKSTAERIMEDGPYQYLMQTLKKWGFERGTKAIEDYGAEHKKQMAAFRENEYPTMRTEGFPALAAIYEKAGRPDKSFALLEAQIAAAENPVQRAELLSRLVQKAPETLRWLDKQEAVKSLAPIERSAALIRLDKRFGNEPGKIPWPPDINVQALYDRTYADTTVDFIAKARRAVNDAERSHNLEYAEAYAAAVENNEEKMFLKDSINSLRTIKTVVK